ncbi:hypothetical protein AURANDRAFT_62941 [Aureococcus anophagefferens]|uniref:Uncharacterized protein n=1 Tax=Aureococcus anophagefferens TaxID=44056 RepID=F0Y4U3_AURAN|nr:hypothetical protein AURANDRAFT_62941 [Aureococcus anophagefferens]EGB09908.1 hypothetical protein AURANDRAFT_62941 [Aureococcus anophagefferens]|eukprot:XP_009035934.1 hypothetical protein AURANDRAFT_62941 [Aureococcus anophagefferens]
MARPMAFNLVQILCLARSSSALVFRAAPRPRLGLARPATNAEWLEACATSGVVSYTDFGIRLAASTPAEAAPAEKPATEESATEAAPAEEPAEAAPEAPTTTIAPPPNLSESVLADFTERSERNLEVARLQTQLERSQLRRKQVEEVVGEELAALRFQLEREVAAEEDRSRSAGALKAQLEAAKRTKADNCAREEQLLVQLQDVAQRTEEAAVAASLAAAIETKAGLVAIELLLIDDVAECVAAVAKEESEIDKRIAAMRTTLASLPAADDADALRLYSWSQVEALQEELRLGALAIAETEASVAALRQRINDALDQRDAVIGSAPVLGVAAPEPPKPAPRDRDGVAVLDLESLDEAGLKDAVASSASATASSFAALGKSLLAFGGADAADTADLAGSALDAFTALGNTAASAGLLAFKAAKKQLDK